MGIPFHVVNFLDGFKEKIIDKFTLTYLRGETPNPCIDCNRYMKFGRLFEMADEQGCEKVVTGHYATVEYDEESGIYRLKRAVDRTKDQTYVLYFLSQQQLSRLVFPDGIYEKTEIRKIASEQSLIVAEKHDSQDICFVPDGNYAGYIERNYSGGISETGGYSAVLPGPGDFKDMDGKVLGQHKGYFHYTIGQRKGLGISAEHPLYVVDIIPETNEVILGINDDLFTRVVHATDFNLICKPQNYMVINNEDIAFRDVLEKLSMGSASDDEEAFGTDEYVERISLSEGDMIMSVTAKVRYRAKDTSGVLILHADKTADMIFDDPVRAVTPGQSLVAYDGDYCIGGGIINVEKY
jgi:tRNA-specific 2-thiouridylase